jgi:hypothetical protein
MKNGCWNCFQAGNPRNGTVWCAYWQAYFPIIIEEENIIEIEDS